MPTGTDLQDFDNQWLPNGFGLTLEKLTESDQFSGNGDEKDITLSKLLTQLEGVITQGMPESV